MARLVIDGKALSDLLRGPTGPVMRTTLVVAEAVKVATINSLKPGFPADFIGPLIVKRVMADATVQVGNQLTRPVVTKPHVINGNPLLVFHWPKAGPGLFFFRSVNHPGSDFTNYLQTKLNEALASVRGV